MRRLDDAMDRLGAGLGEAPLEVEIAVLAEFERVKRRGRARRWIAASAAIAASIAGIAMVEHRAAQQQTSAEGTTAAVQPPGAVQTGDAEQPFVPIPYVLPPAPYERMQVVRMEVPVSALIAAGLRPHIADQGAQAEVDVIVGQDGRPRAVRLISISSMN